MALLNAFFELINAGCRIVGPAVSASTIQGVGCRKSSLGSEQFLDFAKKAACCVEARRDVTEGERQSPEADKMLQNGFDLTKYFHHTPEMWKTQQYTVVSLFPSGLELSGLRIRIKSQDLGIRKEAQSFKGSGFRIIIVEDHDLGS